MPGVNAARIAKARRARVSKYVGRVTQRRRDIIQANRDIRDMDQAIRAHVKKQVMKSHEQKMCFINDQNIQIYHNGTRRNTGGYYLAHANLLSTIVGTSQYTRIGDRIFSQKVSMKLWLSNKGDRPNVMYRIVVIAGESEDMPAGGDVGGTALTGIEYTSSGGNTMLVRWNKDKFKLIRDMYVQPFGGDYSLEPSSSAKEHSRLIEFDIPINKYITYKTDNGTVPENANCYGFFVTAYDAYGTVITDNIASFAWAATHFFKDS